MGKNLPKVTYFDGVIILTCFKRLLIDLCLGLVCTGLTFVLDLLINILAGTKFLR